MSLIIASHHQLWIVERIEGNTKTITFVDADFLRSRFNIKGNFKHVYSLVNHLNKIKKYGEFKEICGIHVPKSKINVGDFIVFEKEKDSFEEIEKHFDINLTFFRTFLKNYAQIV